MNKERVQQLIEVFSSFPDERYDQKDYIYPSMPFPGPSMLTNSKYTMCIGGVACCLFGTENFGARDVSSALDITIDQAFEITKWNANLGNVKQRALNMLKGLLETGEVDWNYVPSTPAISTKIICTLLFRDDKWKVGRSDKFFTIEDVKRWTKEIPNVPLRAIFDDGHIEEFSYVPPPVVEGQFQQKVISQ